MTTTTNPHEEFEIAALRRTRAALDRDASACLDAHLATCAACRAFSATAEATENALSGRTRSAAAARDWESTRSAFLRRRRAARRAAVTAWALTPPLLAVFWWTLAPPLFWCLATWTTAMLVAASRRGADDARSARRAEAVDDDLLAFYRADLDREIAVIRGSKPLFPLLAVSFGGMIVATLALIAKALFFDAGPFDDAGLLMPLVVLPTVFVWLWRRLRVVLPRLERERRELDA